MNIFKKAIVIALFAIPVATSAAAQTNETRTVNINKASVEQLSLLPRIGPAIAERIVEFRKQNGDFKQPQDLLLVRGVGEKLFEMVEPYVRVSGETTLKEKLKAPKALPKPETAKPASKANNAEPESPNR